MHTQLRENFTHHLHQEDKHCKTNHTCKKEVILVDQKVDRAVSTTEVVSAKLQ